MFFNMCNSFDDVVITALVSRWNETTSKPIGRTIIQKLCYFIKSKGVPLGFEFDIHHYGPYSSDLYKRMDDLTVDGVINDRCHGTDACKSVYESGALSSHLLTSNASAELEPVLKDVDFIVRMFNHLNPRSLELFATIHYMNTSYYRFYKEYPPKERVIDMVQRVKGTKFQQKTISGAYDSLDAAGLFKWVN